jgi:hypothetical protein
MNWKVEMDVERLLVQTHSSFIIIRTTLAPTLSPAALEALSVGP